MHSDTRPRHPAGISLLLSGYGKMGSALLECWQHTGDHGITHFHVIEPQCIRTDAPVTRYENLQSLPTQLSPDVIVFAVKPQQLPELLPAYRKRFGITPLYISIAAGKNLAFYKKHLGAKARIVRAMPNTPALVGHGITALCGSALAATDKTLAEKLMGAVGQTLWLDDESQMDAVTALSGSGPAYVFLFLESLTEAGIAAGLPADRARALAMQTIYGSAMLARQSHENFATLRQNVSSPGGTTEAALKLLMQDNAFKTLVKNAVLAAARRAKELAE